MHQRDLLARASSPWRCTGRTKLPSPLQDLLWSVGSENCTDPPSHARCLNPQLRSAQTMQQRRLYLDRRRLSTSNEAVAGYSCLACSPLYSSCISCQPSSPCYSCPFYASPSAASSSSARYASPEFLLVRRSSSSQVNAPRHSAKRGRTLANCLAHWRRAEELLLSQKKKKKKKEANANKQVRQSVTSGRSTRSDFRTAHQSVLRRRTAKGNLLERNQSISVSPPALHRCHHSHSILTNTDSIRFDSTRLDSTQLLSCGG